MKIHRNIAALPPKKRRKYARRLVPYLEEWCLNQGVTEDEIIYNLETTYEGLRLLEEAHPDFAFLMKMRRDRTRAEDMRVARAGFQAGQPGTVKEYLNRKYGLPAPPEAKSDNSEAIADLFREIAEKLPK